MAIKMVDHFVRYYGLSTDVKPTTGTPIGSTFYEMDTQVNYVFNGSTWGVAAPPGAAGAYDANGALKTAQQSAGNPISATNPLPVLSRPSFGTAGLPVAYRAALVAADVLAIPGTVTCTKQAGGSATAGVYNTKVVAGNAYGRTTAKTGNTTVTTETTNLTVRAAFAAVTGATYYDIYCSTDADPKFVGRITETQRASGILLTAVNVTGAGGTAGAVDVQVPGTGQQAATTAAANTAFSLPDDTGVDATGYQYVDFDLLCSVTGDSASLALVVVPFFKDATSTWVAGSAGVQTVSFGGTSGVYYPLQQTLRIEARGRKCHLLIASISGTGASVTMLSGLS